MNEPDIIFQESLTIKYSCQTPLYIDVPGGISVCDKKEVEDMRTFAMNPK